MEDRDPVAEARPEARHGLRREADLGDEDDRRAAAGEGRLDRGEVDLGLARARDAVQEQLAVGAGDAVDRGDDLLGGALLLGQQPRPLARGADRAVLGRAAQARAAGRDQAALLEAAQDLAVGADRGGEPGRRHLPRSAQRLEGGPLPDPEPLGAAQRRLAGGRDLGSQLDPRADPLAAGAGPGGSTSSSPREGVEQYSRPIQRPSLTSSAGAPASSASSGSARRSGGSSELSARSTTTPSTRRWPKGTRTMLPTSSPSISAGRR